MAERDLSDFDVRVEIYEKFLGRLSPAERKGRLRPWWDAYRRNAIRLYSRRYFGPNDVASMAKLEARVLQHLGNTHGDQVIRTMVLGIADRLSSSRFNNLFSDL